MPWVDKKECIGCGECITQCPVNAIYLVEEKAEINIEDCIRCGTCHGVCPEKAVKHDSLKIPFEVDANIAKTEKLMEACAKHLGGEQEREKCLNRMIKYFTNQKVIAEKTLEKLQMIQQG